MNCRLTGPLARSLARITRGSLKFTMITQHLLIVLAEMFGQAFDQMHGSVASAGAAYADGHVTAAFALESGQPGCQKIAQLILEKHGVRTGASRPDSGRN